ncbi:hypothetical protein [Nevskia sp.]|uniref:hypothetical protein n=1 Tax=Nevskia sp. TaxID=1929292 RepID=UPI003F719726
MSRLKFPDHFPPTNPWKKFFIGVRWLGPDLSFFGPLKRAQASRTPESMAIWTGRQLEVASAIGDLLACCLGWKSPYFMPDDMVDVVFHGPSFDSTDPESVFEAVVEMLDERFSIRPTEEFWRGHANSTFGQLVEGIVAHGAA